MKALLIGNGLNGKSSDILGVAEINTSESPAEPTSIHCKRIDFVSVFDILSSVEIAEYLRGCNLQYTCNVVSALARPNGFAIELKPLSYDRFNVFDLGSSWQSVKDENIEKVSGLLGITSAESNLVLTEINSSFMRIISDSKSGALTIYSSWLQVFPFSPQSAELDLGIFKNYVGVRPMPISMDSKINNPTDTVSFAVPTVHQLAMVYPEVLETPEDESQEDMDTEDAENIGGNPNSEDSTTTEFATYDADQGATMDFGMIAPNIVKNIPLSKITPFFESVAIRSVCDLTKDFNIADIIGHPEKNQVEIQPNERMYADALDRLIRNGIRLENSILSNECVDGLVASHVHSILVDNYLKSCSRIAYNYNYCHTGFVIGNTEEYYGSGSDDDNSHSDNMLNNLERGCFTVEYVNGKFQRRKMSLERVAEDSYLMFRDGFPAIEKYMETFTSDTFAWVEMYIKLLRWGSMKPRLLYVNGAKLKDREIYFDTMLNKQTNFSGTFTNYTTKPDPATGFKLNIDDVIWCDCVVQDNKYFNDLLGVSIPSSPKSIKFPVGVSVLEKFEDVVVDHLDIFDIFTLCRAIKDEENPDRRIGGIVYDKLSKTFKVDTEKMPGLKRSSSITDTLMIISDNGKVDTPTMLTLHPNPNVLVELQKFKSVLNIRNVNVSSVNLFKLLVVMLYEPNIQFRMTTAEGVNVSSLQMLQQLKQSWKASTDTDVSDADILNWAIIREFVVRYFILWHMMAVYAEEQKIDITNVPFSKILSFADILNENAITLEPIKTLSPQFTSLVTKIQKAFPILSGGSTIGYAGMVSFAPHKVTRLMWSVSEYDKQPASDILDSKQSLQMDGVKKIKDIYDAYKGMHWTQAKLDEFCTLATPNTFNELYREAGRVLN